MKYIYNGMEYTTYKSLAVALGVSSTTLRNYEAEEGSLEEAVKKINEKKQAQEIYVYKGNEYTSVLQLSQVVNIERRILNRILQNSPREGNRIIADEGIDNHLSKRNVTYTYKGVTYNTITDAAKSVGLQLVTLSKYLKLADNDMEKAMELFEAEHTYAIVDEKRFTSAEELANYLNINPITLKKYIQSEGSIEGAVKKAREKNATIEWEGKEYSSLESLANAMGIPRPTLKRYLEQYDGDVPKAYEAYQKRNSGKYRGYIYEGQEFSSLDKLLNHVGIAKVVYHREVKKYNGDWKATIEGILEGKKIREQKRKTKLMEQQQREKEKEREEKIVDYIYEGKIYHSIGELSKLTGISRTHVARLLAENDNNLDVALESRKEKNQYTYNGRTFESIKALAEYTGIRELRLGRYIRKYDRDAEKAIFMIKLADSRKKEITIDETKLTTQDLAIILGIKHMELVSLLNAGKTIEEIQKEIPQKTTRKFVSRERKITINGESLSEYCIKHRINYSCIYYLIQTYGKTPEEAIDNYKRNGQKVPESWIFEKYGVLLKHLLLNEGVSSKRVVNIMRANGISLKDAVENYIVDENAKEVKLDRHWMREVYSFLYSQYLSNEEKQDFEETFMISSKEKECIEKSKKRIDEVERKMLLVEMLDSIKDGDFSEKEITELMILYGITQDEVKTMFLDFDSDFNDKILLAENQPEKQEKLKIKKYAENWFNLSDNEKAMVKQNVSERDFEYIVTSAENIRKYQQAVGDATIIKVMRDSVGRNVESNAKVRTELKSIEKTKE